jgi:adenylate cyclase
MTREVKTMAILFADITESSRLYQQLGDASARAVINMCLSTLANILPRYDGRLVKTMGDAIMCVFPTADSAVLAASEMQTAVAAGRTGSHPLRIHVGLHQGPVLVEDGDVFGDTVNSAAYITAVAMAEQVLTTDATEQALSAALKASVRPLFHAVLKGNNSESTIYQVLWRTDNMDLTDVNLTSVKAIPGDTGSLLIGLGDERIRVDQWRPTITAGRSASCDLVIADQMASRRHLTIKLTRTSYCLIDHSANGTFVTLESGDEIHLLRGELVLEGAGQFRAGRSRVDNPAEVMTFARDRRSLYRI